jgi:hypothetical protein
MIFKLVIRVRNGNPYHCWIKTKNPKVGDIIKVSDISDGSNYVDMVFRKEENDIPYIGFNELLDEIHFRMIQRLRDYKIDTIINP